MVNPGAPQVFGKINLAICLNLGILKNSRGSRMLNSSRRKTRSRAITGVFTQVPAKVRFQLGELRDTVQPTLMYSNQEHKSYSKGRKWSEERNPRAKTRTPL